MWCRGAETWDGETWVPGVAVEIPRAINSPHQWSVKDMQSWS